MRKKNLHLLSFLAFLFCAYGPQASAQDGLPNPELNGYLYQDTNPYDEKPLLLEGELKNKITRDSAQSIRPTRTPATGTKTASTESRKSAPRNGDDALNHNFLYYIIQKFKSSDLIEE